MTDAMRIHLVHLVRVLRRSPASAAAAILTLALTLGAGASIFAVVDAVLLTPPPFADPDRLVTAGETPRDAPPTETPRAIGYTTLEAWRDRAAAERETVTDHPGRLQRARAYHPLRAFAMQQVRT